MQGQQLQTDAFDKVEMTYGLGLRASDPTTRDKFYKLWNKAIPPSLFERLKHVILVQNWEEMGNNFWLKQAVVSAVAAFSNCNCCLFQLLFVAVTSFCSVWQAGISTLIQCHHHLIMLMTVLAVLPPVWLNALLSVADIQQLVLVRS